MIDLIVVHLTLCLSFGLALAVVLVPIYYQFYWIPLVFVVWFYLDSGVKNKGGRCIGWFRRSSIWTYYANYFPSKLIKTVDLPPTTNYLFCAHPHGIIPHGIIVNFATEGAGYAQIFPGLVPHVLTLNAFFLGANFSRFYFECRLWRSQ